ncbi:MAG: hypothetical protein JW704_10255, partial [Anaerolineaceae bacterium]|nr:hypothetical protein [Anaerolineaceae bacterium]
MKNRIIINKNLLRSFTIIAFMLTVACPARPVHALGTVFVSPTGSGSACTPASPCDLATGLSTVDAWGTLYAAGGTYTASSG